MRPTTPRRLFITGATGYLGSRLIPRLLERGHHVTALARQGSFRNVPSGCLVVVGRPLESPTFVEQVRGADTFVQLVGVPKPSPWKGPQFRAIDGPSAMAAIRAARAADVQHFVYVSVAHPAPMMKDYIAVRTECEAAIGKARLIATILRPWYILGPGHWCR
ncbi:MAG: NAD(P)H-binding protein [Nitrospira sp.]